jgi:succinyl-diaminopimelate desuccinylase
MDLQLALMQALEAYRAPMLAFAQDLLRIPTENPPGNHYREGMQRICQELERLGLPCQVVEVPGYADRPRYNVLSFYGHGSPTLYFHGHYDVVPAHSRAQFEPRVEGGRLYGRGAADMKAALATMIYAVHLLQEQQVPLQGRIGLCIAQVFQGPCHGLNFAQIQNREGRRIVHVRRP